LATDHNIIQGIYTPSVAVCQLLCVPSGLPSTSKASAKPLQVCIGVSQSRGKIVLAMIQRTIMSKSVCVELQECMAAKISANRPNMLDNIKVVLSLIEIGKVYVWNQLEIKHKRL
jgi:hypothetical protein